MSRFPFPMPRRSSRRRRQRPMFGVGQNAGGRRGGGGLKMRLLIAAGLALFALVSYYGNPGDRNQVTGQMERVAYAEEKDEVALGLQAVPQMMQQHRGPSSDGLGQRTLDDVGRRLLAGLDRWIAERSQQTGEELTNPYRGHFEFTLLEDRQTVNAFALPGGQVFMTKALYDRFDQSPGDPEALVAGVLGHEIGHVIERHGNKRMAKQKLFSGLAMAGGVAGGDANSQRMAQMAAQMVSMKYGREDELESDKWGVRLMVYSGYDPRAMIGVMKVLDEASGGGGPPEMLSTHPKPANRIQYIQRVIKEEFPDGLPGGLKF